MATSPVGCPLSSTSASHRAESPGAAVTAAAQPALSPPVSEPPAAPLTGRIKPFNIVDSRLREAHQKLKNGNLGQAHALYQTALAKFESFKEQQSTVFVDPSNFPAACYIGMAKTCDPSERANNVNLADKALRGIDQNKAKWDALDPKTKSIAYFGFKRNLQAFKSLAEASRHAEINSLIEECKKQILPIDDAYHELMKGQDLFKQQNIKGARAAYDRALSHFDRMSPEDALEPEYHIIKTSIFISYAKTYEQEQSERVHHCQSATSQIELLHLAIQTHPTVNAYKILLNFCNQLMELSPDPNHSFLQPIPSLIKECQSKIAPDNRDEPNESGRGSIRQPTFSKLLVAFAVARLAIFLGVELYRRMITKLE